VICFDELGAEAQEAGVPRRPRTPVAPPVELPVQLAADLIHASRYDAGRSAHKTNIAGPMVEYRNGDVSSPDELTSLTQGMDAD
jgi:hypothetical protein